MRWSPYYHDLLFNCTNKSALNPDTGGGWVRSPSGGEQCSFFSIIFISQGVYNYYVQLDVCN